MSYALRPAAHIAPQIAPPEHAVSEAGRMPASSKARATPISDTHAPPPPVAITATRLSASAGTGRAAGRRRSGFSTAGGCSIQGIGRSARRARRRNAGSAVSRSRSPSSFVRANARFRP